MKTQSFRGEGKDRVSGGYSIAKIQSLLLGQKIDSGEGIFA
jgi:hypothetical protein